MKIRIQLFAIARELCGSSSVDLELPAGSRLSDLRADLGDRQPALAPYLAQCLFSVNADYASDKTLLNEGDAVACIPPVSGG